MKSPIKVWRFEDAPERFRCLSTHGGDEDWLAVLPASWTEPYLPLWMEDGTNFGPCSVHRVDLPDGRAVVIGAHA